MKVRQKKKILSTIGRESLVGRQTELSRLVKHAREESSGLVLLSAPSSGASELLRQAYDQLFLDQQEIIPVYFEFRQSDGNARMAANRFVSEFLIQTTAFRRRDAGIISASPQISELGEMALPADGHWVDRLIEAHLSAVSGDERSFVRQCLSSSARAADTGARHAIFLDNLDAAAQLGASFLDDLIEIFSRSSGPVVLAGHRRLLFGQTTFQTLSLDALPFSDVGRIIENLTSERGVALTDQARDLIAVQLTGHLGNIARFITAAANDNIGLTTFENVERVYTQEIFGGSISLSLGALFDRITPSVQGRRRILRLLDETIESSDRKLPIEYWERQARLDFRQLTSVLTALHEAEFIDATSGTVAIDPADAVFCDYVRARVRMELNGAPRAQVVGDALTENIKRSPQLMARFYRRISAINLRTVLGSFDGRPIAAGLIDYETFSRDQKGADDKDILSSLNEAEKNLTLPHIVYTADASAFYPSIDEVCDSERAAVAFGFTDDAARKEVAWIVAEIDSKLEATAEMAEFWCDRLEMVAVNCGFEHYKIWLVAPEGFNSAAVSVLKGRNAYGSSRKQIELLSAVLNVKGKVQRGGEGSEYEIVLPMGEDTEMIAAHTIEDVVRRHNFPTKIINQIKTALVEACINAAEHSLSPDRRIYQKFSVDADKITITVSNRGTRLTDKIKPSNESEDGRRGWGLKLIRSLMDEVTIEQTDDGTSIRMVKFNIRPQ